MFIQNYSLLAHNTFGIDVCSKFFIHLTHISQISGIMDEVAERNLDFIILGEGSNMLFTRDFDGLVIHNSLKGIEKVSEEEEEIQFRVSAGENWDAFVGMTVSWNYGGLENLSLIPGSVGASPVQNIGAYGVEVKDSVVKVEGYSLPDSSFVTFSNEECGFGYRESIFKKKWKNRLIITSVVFRLQRNPVFRISYGEVARVFEQKKEQNLQSLRDTIIEIRRSKLPEVKEYGSAGSFFKNPVISAGEYRHIRERWPDIPGYEGENGMVKISAAWLIEKSGWKGVREGSTGTWPQQPLVLVNYGFSSGREIFKFSEKIRKSVYDQFGIDLGREVNVY